LISASCRLQCLPASGSYLPGSYSCCVLSAPAWVLQSLTAAWISPCLVPACCLPACWVHCLQVLHLPLIFSLGLLPTSFTVHLPLPACLPFAACACRFLPACTVLGCLRFAPCRFACTVFPAPPAPAPPGWVRSCWVLPISCDSRYLGHHACLGATVALLTGSVLFRSCLGHSALGLLRSCRCLHLWLHSPAWVVWVLDFWVGFIHLPPPALHRSRL